MVITICGTILEVSKDFSPFLEHLTLKLTEVPLKIAVKKEGGEVEIALEEVTL